LSAINGISVFRATGSVVEGEALVSTEGFSPRYDLDRLTGEISRPGHAIAGENIAGKILFFPTAKGGIAAGWAFYDLASKDIAPKAIVFGRTNPVMVQGAVFAGITITEGWSENPTEVFRTGDTVRVDPHRKTVGLLKRA
jgi:uncharacterized protein